MIKATYQNFWTDTSGAMTLPWIATAAAVVMIGVAATSMMEPGSEALQEDNRSFFESIDNTGGEGTYD